MLLMDVNVLVYAHRQDALDHARYQEWLESVLSAEAAYGVTDLVLSGVATNWAVESTARDGICRGYFIYTLEDCCLSLNDEMHDWALKNILSVLGAVIDSKTYVAALQGRVP